MRAAITGPRVFISYRREDTAYAGRISDRLVQVLGPDGVFFDLDSIQPGVLFAQTLLNRIESCDAMLAVISKSWIHSFERFNDVTDYVVFEISTALNKNIQVVPVLVGGAALPARKTLPESIARLGDRQALTIPDQGFLPALELVIPIIQAAAAPRVAREKEDAALRLAQQREEDARRAAQERAEGETARRIYLQKYKRECLTVDENALLKALRSEFASLPGVHIKPDLPLSKLREARIVFGSLVPAGHQILMVHIRRFLTQIHIITTGGIGVKTPFSQPVYWRFEDFSASGFSFCVGGTDEFKRDLSKRLRATMLHVLPEWPPPRSLAEEPISQPAKIH